MNSKKYRLSYLPLFYEDLDEKITYIVERLKNPKAARDLLDKVEAAIMERLPVAESFEPYHSTRERRYAYYRIYVDNYIIYYVVIDDKILIDVIQNHIMSTNKNNEVQNDETKNPDNDYNRKHIPLCADRLWRFFRKPDNIR